MSEDSPPDRALWLRFLTLLQEHSPDRVLDRLPDLLEDLPSIDLTRGSDAPGSLPLTGKWSLRLNQVDAPDEYFFRWWARAYRDRRRHDLDALTGLVNRSAWERRLRDRVARRGSAWIALADVDHFKRFNDRYGHDVGDDVLESVGAFLRDGLNEDDIAVRYGGEEFLVVTVDEPSAPERVKSLRSALGNQTLFENQPEPVTLSMGLARYEGGGQAPLIQTIERADRALYHSKAEGRNRSTRFAPYLRHRERWSIWGFYRYLDDPDCRFAPGPDHEFLISRGNRVYRYDWLRNQSRPVIGDVELHSPLHKIVYAGECYWLLDGEGGVGTIRDGTLRRIGGEQDHPRFVELVAAREGPRLVGLDNGVYEVGGEPTRVQSLPARWHHVACRDSLFTVRGDRLTRWSTDGADREWTVPDVPRQLISLEESLVVLGESGTLYRFDPAVGRWVQVVLPDFNGGRVHPRELAGHGQRLLLRDARDRLLYLGLRTKAVPQSMNLEGTSDPG